MTTTVINGNLVPVEMRHSTAKGLLMRIYGNGVDNAPTDIVFMRDSHVGRVDIEPIRNEEYRMYDFHHQ